MFIDFNNMGRFVTGYGHNCVVVMDNDYQIRIKFKKKMNIITKVSIILSLYL